RLHRPWPAASSSSSSSAEPEQNLRCAYSSYVTSTESVSGCDWQARISPSSRSCCSKTSLTSMLTLPSRSVVAQAPQWPSRQEKGASRPASSSTSSSLARRGHDTVCVCPSSSTTAVACGVSPLSSLLSIFTAANGSVSSDRN